jgi:predicted nuclease of predicted toxin-antitoxin system
LGGSRRMKLLFDQNLSHRLVAQLAIEFPGSAHVRDARLATAADPNVWAYSAANGFVIVSKDTDFQQRALLYGHPPKVTWVRLGNCSTAAVAALLRSRLADIQAFEIDPVASFLALS